MIIPTPDFDPLFADDGVPFRDKMADWIADEFGDILGPRVTYLRDEHGLDVLSSSYCQPRDDQHDRAA